MKKHTIYSIILSLMVAATSESLFAESASAPAPTQAQQMNNAETDKMNLGSENSIPNNDPITKQTQIYCLEGNNPQYVIANMHFCKKHGSFLYGHSYPCPQSTDDAIAACKTLGASYISQFNTSAAANICNSINGRNQGGVNKNFLDTSGLCISK